MGGNCYRHNRGHLFDPSRSLPGFGSAESSAGHYLGSALNGTPLEQPAVSMERAGEGLTATADNDIMGFTALLVVGLLIAAAVLDS